MKDTGALLIYNLIRSALTGDGRDILFGDRLEVDSDVFEKSYAGGEFPEIWYELPLLGKPWYDLHVLTSRNAVGPETEFDGGLFYPELFRWFANNTGVRQLAMSHDLSKGEYDNPAVQLLVGVRDPSVGCDFLCEAGNGAAASAYRTFVDSIPQSWFACYLGTFPERDDVNLRVECIPDTKTQEIYAGDTEALRGDLALTGFAISDEMLEFIRFMAKQPVPIEFQFNVEPDGSAAPVLGVSLRFLIPIEKYFHLSFSAKNENVVSLMQKLEGAGLCDDRWQYLPDCAFAKRLSVGDVSARFGGYPAFIKVRLSPEELIDAKTYIVAKMWS